jgi:hypothetical protein
MLFLPDGRFKWIDSSAASITKRSRKCLTPNAASYSLNRGNSFAKNEEAAKEEAMLNLRRLTSQLTYYATS